MENKKINNNILWTGGWDSTFRLCQLIFIIGEKVQPFYLIDEHRRSHVKELDTMDTIRNKIYEKIPYSKELLNPTITYKLDEISDNRDITEKYNRLKQKTEVHLGSQYNWLPRFAHQIGLDNLEMAVHKDFDSLPKLMAPYIDSFLNEYGKYSNKISSKFYGEDIYIFKYFSFPLLDFTKKDMKEYAEDKGFIDILEHSWFCFKPINNQPCGLCNPCRHTIEQGMAYRLPKIARLRYRYRSIINKINSLALSNRHNFL